MSEKQLSKEQPPKPIGDECDGSDSENGEKMTDMYQGMKDKMTRDSDSEEECDAVVREPISAQITSSSSKAIGEEAAAVTKPAVTKKTKSSTENAPVSKKLFLDFAHSPNALAVNKSLAIWKFNDSNSSQLQIKSTKRIGNELKTEFKGNAKKRNRSLAQSVFGHQQPWCQHWFENQRNSRRYHWKQSFGASFDDCRSWSIDDF